MDFSEVTDDAARTLLEDLFQQVQVAEGGDASEHDAVDVIETAEDAPGRGRRRR